MGKGSFALLQQLDGSSASVVLPLSSRFPTKAAEDLMRSFLESYLKGETYAVDKASQLAKKLAISLKDSLRELCRPRYRLAVSVLLAEDCGQGLTAGCRCFWDKQTDSMATTVYRNASIFCLATAYAVYLY